MLAITQAIAQIDRMKPQPIPHVATPALPELGAVGELARITGGNPAQVLKSAHAIAQDSGAIDDIQRQAQGLIGGCISDLVGIGMAALKRAIPVAVGLLVPNPTVRAGAQMMLRAIAGDALREALGRLAQLVQELLGLAGPLREIASRSIQGAISGEGEAARRSLQAEHAGGARQMLASAEAPAIAGLGAAEGSGGGSAQGQAAVDAALGQVGTPYAWGGTGAGGFDCSGLTQWAYRQAGIELPRLAQEQTVGTQVSADQLQPGDLVVWDGHVAMYAGDGQIVEAGDPVQTNPLRTTNMGMAFKGFWRPTG